MIRFIICTIIVILAFLFFFNAERFIPHLAGNLPAPVSEEAPTEELPTEETAVEAVEEADEENTEADDEPVGDEPESPEAPDADVLTDADGKVFSYLPAGDLIANSHPPSILVDNVVYDEQITFPTEDAVFLNSQKWRFGGDMAHQNLSLIHI